MPYIKEEAIKRVQAASDIINIAESYGLKLRRTGSNFSALCPFHKEKTPSFSLNPQLQYFKCFGCGVAGGAIKFVQIMERCEFVDAVKQLAQRNNIELDYENPRHNNNGENVAPKKEPREPLLWANKMALEYFRQSLKNGGQVAYDYLRERGFTDDTINAWSLGWSPDSWDGLIDFCKREVLKNGDESKIEKMFAVGIASGIFRQKENSDHPYDAFRGRVMFPIFDNQQRPIGFGGRVLVENAEAGGKYLNTSETPLFQKRSLLFGLNFAAREIGHTHTAIVVEGYTDTIMCHQYGVRNVVATLGTALTTEHIKILRRYVGAQGKVIALFDADNAGRRATERAIEIFMQEDVNLLVLQDLAVKDAGEFLPKFGGEKFREFLSTAKDSFTYTLTNTLGKNFGNDLSAKSAAVMKIMGLVNLCPNAIRRDLMRSQVAQTAQVDVDLLPHPQAKKTRAEIANNNDDAEITTNATSALTQTFNPAQKRQRASELSLLRYMSAEKKWCAYIMDHYPADDWHLDELHRVAVLLREQWQNNEKPDLGLLITQTTNDDLRTVLIDLLDAGDLPPLHENEMHQILQRLSRDDLLLRKKKLQEQLTHAELCQQDDDVTRLLNEISALDKKIKPLSEF